MKAKRKPINREGVRNALCPYYKKCLNLAVKKSWAHWDCEECTHKDSIDPEFNIEGTLRNPVAYYDLPLEIHIKI